MQIFNFELGPLGVNSFLIIPENSDAVLIDAPEGSFDAVSKHLAPFGKKVGALLLTHGHWDHIWDAKKFQDAGAKIYAHPEGKIFVEGSGAQNAYMFGESGLENPKIDKYLYDGEILEFGDCKIEARHTPGHCAGSVIFYIKDKDIAFVGDLIFAQSVGRTDMPTGDFALLQKSIKNKIYTLPDSCKLLPGHGEFTSVEIEKHSNPYVSE